ncbi:hypothetical protein B005_3587 [Nocardiopsis alba ATCC BAA-2165]|uniref:Uncharacterized protein n=1 Tax=Nocardiopsis alba (strain ATCC BAA-2165 / BE74) TaxID=1205910 RepID=J7L6D1_NOCAA|nr:hypothetical protein B005_3587 [Nocardiopsis alba ATCC BAA-2165]
MMKATRTVGGAYVVHAAAPGGVSPTERRPGPPLSGRPRPRSVRPERIRRG